LVEAGQLRPQVEAVLALEQVREALERVAGRHTRAQVVLQILIRPSNLDGDKKHRQQVLVAGRRRQRMKGTLDD
jgi:hypothetical protein